MTPQEFKENAGNLATILEGVNKGKHVLINIVGENGLCLCEHPEDDNGESTQEIIHFNYLHPRRKIDSITINENGKITEIDGELQ